MYLLNSYYNDLITQLCTSLISSFKQSEFVNVDMECSVMQSTASTHYSCVMIVRGEGEEPYAALTLR